MSIVPNEIVEKVASLENGLHIVGDFMLIVDNGKISSRNTPAVYGMRKYTGIFEWHLNGELHSDTGPAIDCFGGPDKGRQEYYLHGKRHRTNGPALVMPDGSKAYYLNGELHREDGPAVEHASGIKEYWVLGVPLCGEYKNGIVRYVWVISQEISSVSS